MKKIIGTTKYPNDYPNVSVFDSSVIKYKIDNLVKTQIPTLVYVRSYPHWQRLIESQEVENHIPHKWNREMSRNTVHVFGKTNFK